MSVFEIFEENKKRFPNWGDGEICYDNEVIDVFCGIVEFYVIESISVMAHPIPFNHGHDKWIHDFEEFKDRYVSQFARAFFDYTVSVCLGEARHGWDQSNYVIAFLMNYEIDRDTLYNCPHLDPKSVLETCVRLFFCSDEWENGYGGEAWREIAKGGLMYYTLPPSVFIDHMVDLSHNNGIFYNKRNNIFNLVFSNGTVKFFLDLKRNNSPRTVYEYGCKRFPSYEIKKFYKRAINLGIIAPCSSEELEIVRNGLCGFSPFTAPQFNDDNIEAVMNYTPIKWGTSRIYPSDVEWTGNLEKRERERERLLERERKTGADVVRIKQLF